MKQISTGAGLLGLGVCMLGAAVIATQRGGEAFAQGTGGDRRIVSASVMKDGEQLIAFRIWSDNIIEARLIGRLMGCPYGAALVPDAGCGYTIAPWVSLDDGSSSPLRADVDQSRIVDAGDISAVLLDFGHETGDPPPPIDCTINAPR